MSNQLITIIVPIYNVEKYIKECLDSLLYEKRANIILVNDGSTDDSGNIAQLYASLHSNFSYFEKENGGLSSARNKGISYCKTKYIAFCDSDDWVEKNMYTKLAELAELEDLDIVSCGMFLNYDDKEIEVPLKESFYNLENDKELLELLENIKVAAWDKVYKYDLFNSKIEYPYGLYFEDTPTIGRLLIEAKKVKLINSSYYHYRQREGSIVNQKEFNEKYFDIFEGLEILKDYKTENYKKKELIYNYLYVRKGLVDSVIRLFNFKVFQNIKYKLYIRNKINFTHLLKFKGHRKYTLYITYIWIRTYI